MEAYSKLSSLIIIDIIIVSLINVWILIFKSIFLAMKRIIQIWDVQMFIAIYTHRNVTINRQSKTFDSSVAWLSLFILTNLMDCHSHSVTVVSDAQTINLIKYCHKQSASITRRYVVVWVSDIKLATTQRRMMLADCLS